MNYIIFAIILLHLIGGFGWLFYKLEIQKKSTDDDKNKDANKIKKPRNDEN